jgi:ketosteroid isomerase-like protein
MEEKMQNTHTALSTRNVAEMFAAIDRGDVDAVTAHFRDDVKIRLGNNDPVHGKDGFAAMLGQFTSSLKGVRHELHDAWHAAEDGNVLVVTLTVHYTRPDDRVVSLPCCNVFGLADGLVVHYQVYFDIGPVFS